MLVDNLRKSLAQETHQSGFTVPMYERPGKGVVNIADDDVRFFVK